VNDDYYLVNSSFEYFPGVPVFHSRDLVNWRHIGNCLTRVSQLPLEKAPCSGGIYAPTLRFHNNRFYMVTTNVSGGGNFFVTARDPAGPWSDPVWLEQDGIDPSLLFDEDGKVYLAGSAGGAQGAIIQSEIDPETGQIITPARIIWKGTGGQYPEAPHLYRINGIYYLMIAEGGTDWGHMVTIARSNSPWGPFTPCPHNPILTHRSTCLPIQCTGHADLVQDSNWRWWLFFLGTRPHRHWHHLGRETFLAPVEWNDDGWPVVGDHGQAGPAMDADLPEPHLWPPQPIRDDFDRPALRLQWNMLRNPRDGDRTLTERPGWLRLRGSAVTLSDVDSPAFAGRRQQHMVCTVRTRLSFDPSQEGDEAGLTTLMNERHHYELAVTRRDGVRALVFRRTIGTLSNEQVQPLQEDGPVELEIRADREWYIFGHYEAAGRFRETGRGETRYLSKEVAGGFTGVYVGLYANGRGRPCATPADFDWFEYEGITDHC
jgi:alpha-N-arabinofuranosidase